MTYKPGTIAKATVRGVRGVTIVRHDYRPGHNAYSVTFEWFDITTASWVLSVDVTDVRPLVVLDLADYLDVNWQDFITVTRRRAEEINSTAVGWLVDEIEKQTRPAIEEPKGLGAVVEDAEGKRWLRVCEHDDCNSWAQVLGQKGDASGIEDSPAARREWCESFDAVRVLSEGVPS